jgi:Fibronectin type III domain
MSDPPFLNIPAKAETVTPNASQNINFQWTPRHTASPNAGYSTDYVFSITEVLANDFSPESAFTSHQALYTDSTAATMYNYGPSKPLLIAGKKYAWRVQAKAKQGLDNLAMFRNFGYSEVFWFDYKNNCTPPLSIAASVQGSRVTITWQPQPIYLSYKVEYRETNNASAEWFTINTLEPTVVLNDLNFGKEYQYRVGASCEEESFNYSNLLTFTTGAAAVPVIANCGDSSAIPNTVPQTYLATMAVGDTILAGDFKVKILTISGSTSFTGTGTVKIPWLLGVKAAVRFSGIKVNTLKQLAVGNIETTYDPKEAGILNVDDVIDILTPGYGVGNPITGQAGADTTVGFPIQWPGGITAVPSPGYNPPTVNGPATITIVGVGGTPSITIVAQTLPKTIMDSTGNIYQVNNTNPITVTLLAQGGGKTMLSKTTKSLIDADKAIVKFVPYEAKSIYAFDEWNPLYKNSGAYNKEYEKISCIGGGDCIDGGAYYVSAKAIAPGKTDYLKATVTLVDNSINPDSIQFVNGKGLIYTKKRVDSAVGVYRYGRRA